MTDTDTRKPKRGHGEGTIYQRESDGRWVGTIMLGRKPNGRPDRPKVTGTTRGEVQKQLAALRRKADQGTRGDPAKERQTLAAFLENWLTTAGTSVRPHTLDVYTHNVRNHIVPTLGHHKLSALRPDAVQALYAAKVAQGFSAGTIQKIHVVLHRALAMAVKWGYVPSNVADGAVRPKASKHELPTPGPDELKRLIDSAESAGDRFAPLWTLFIHSGCRRGELLALQWTDVDVERRTITIRRTMLAVKGAVPTYGDPKSNSSRRTITISEEAVTALRGLRAQQNADRLKADDWADYGLVFTTHVGTPLMPRNVMRAFKVALGRAGLPRTTRIHDLRHAHATLMLRAGVPLKVASRRLGHSSTGITADLYQHVTPDLDTDAAQRVALVLK